VPAAGGADDRNRPAVLLGNAAHDGEAQTGAGRHAISSVRGTVELLEHAGKIRFGNTDPGVLDLQPDRIAMPLKPHRHPAASWV